LEDKNQLRMTVFASMFAALTAAGAYIAIPIGPVPIVLQNLFILLAGLLLGSRWGLISIAVYLLAGVCGLPVFAGGTGGIGKLVGPTGGYLVGFLPAVWIIGLISEKGKGRLAVDLVAMILGSLVVYAFGIIWLRELTGMSLGKTLSVGMIPFLPGDAIKIAVAIPAARALRPVIAGRYQTS
jgi:biotin transport system substrate-specific component